MKNMAWFKENGCDLAVNEKVVPFLEIFMASDGEPCLGCFETKTCPAYKKLAALRNQRKPAPGIIPKNKNNSIIAARLGISKR